MTEVVAANWDDGEVVADVVAVPLIDGLLVVGLLLELDELDDELLLELDEPEPELLLELELELLEDWLVVVLEEVVDPWVVDVVVVVVCVVVDVEWVDVVWVDVDVVQVPARRHSTSGETPLTGATPLLTFGETWLTGATPLLTWGETLFTGVSPPLMQGLTFTPWQVLAWEMTWLPGLAAWTSATPGMASITANATGMRIFSAQLFRAPRGAGAPRRGPSAP